MKRRHYFEFEDKSWLPGWLRECMTLYIELVHRVLNTPEQIAPLVAKAMKASSVPRIIDLCSGAGGPMPAVAEQLPQEGEVEDFDVVLTDLYPNEVTAKRLNHEVEGVRYEEASVNAADVPEDLKGVRTLICSLHPMRPETAGEILRDASRDRQPLMAFEISDNSALFILWWTAIRWGF